VIDSRLSSSSSYTRKEFQIISASSKELISGSYMEIRRSSHIEKIRLTFYNDRIGIRVRKGSQDAKADDLK